MLQMKSQAPWLPVMLLALMLPLSSCAARHLAAYPAPVVGIDIAEVHVNDMVPFNGTLFSPRYLNEYLQFQCSQAGTC